MNWYYVNAAGQQAGPVDDAGLDGLAASGVVNAETLIWAEGMANWLPLREARPGAYAAAAPVGVPAGGGLSIATGGEEAVCAECGGVFPINDTIRIGNARVCAQCKPIFVQKMREGVNVESGGSFRYAGFWIRFAAKIVDGLIIGAVFVVVVVAYILLLAGSARNNPLAMMGIQLIQLGAIGFQVVYTTFFHGKYGATPGKMACKIWVVRSDGSRLTYGRAFGRAMAEVLSGMICDIGYIIAGFDSEKRSLHDHMCDTRVVYK